MGNNNGNGRSGFAYDGFQLDKGWPGLDVGEGIDVHHDRVKNLLKALEEDVERLKGVNAGTVAHLRVNGRVTPAHLGDWDAAQQLAAVFSQGHTSLTMSYEKLITQYEAAITVIKASFLNIGKADSASDVGK
ncbi:hypothetical protein [Sphaerisporangium corydalis]|uniref:PE domain-containing protein n=1 Tax=Sphaerisporangium corydalis TaxID=1441875 RepID=A0ABV9E598_9ACTN|nr:hypothetical protein [Sphaerisporangium corydalis]